MRVSQFSSSCLSKWAYPHPLGLTMGYTTRAWPCGWAYLHRKGVSAFFGRPGAYPHQIGKSVFTGHSQVGMSVFGWVGSYGRIYTHGCGQVGKAQCFGEFCKHYLFAILSSPEPEILEG